VNPPPLLVVTTMPEGVGEPHQSILPEIVTYGGMAVKSCATMFVATFV